MATSILQDKTTASAIGISGGGGENNFTYFRVILNSVSPQQFQLSPTLFYCDFDAPGVNADSNIQLFGTSDNTTNFTGLYNSNVICAYPVGVGKIRMLYAHPVTSSVDELIYTVYVASS